MKKITVSKAIREGLLEEMRRDGTSLKIIGKYLDDPEKYLEVDDLGY